LRSSEGDKRWQGNRALRVVAGGDSLTDHWFSQGVAALISRLFKGGPIQGAHDSLRAGESRQVVTGTRALVAGGDSGHSSLLGEGVGIVTVKEKVTAAGGGKNRYDHDDVMGAPSSLHTDFPGTPTPCHGVGWGGVLLCGVVWGASLVRVAHI